MTLASMKFLVTHHWQQWWTSNDQSSGDTTPMPSTSRPNHATVQGNAPNPRGEDLNPNNDPIPSNHGSFRSDCSDAAEPTELLAQAMSKLVDFVTKDKQETPSMKVQDPVIVLHFTNFLTVHQKNLDQMYIINGVLSDRYECYSKEYTVTPKTLSILTPNVVWDMHCLIA